MGYARYSWATNTTALFGLFRAISAMLSSEERQESMDAKRAVITGGAAFLGSHLCDALLPAGWNVIVRTNNLSG